MLWKFISKSISPPTKFRDGKIPVLGLSTAVTFVPPIFCNLTPPIWSFLFLLHLCLNKAVCYSSTQWQLSHKKKKKKEVYLRVLPVTGQFCWILAIWGLQWSHCGDESWQQAMKRGHKVRITCAFSLHHVPCFTSGNGLPVIDAQQRVTKSFWDMGPTHVVSVKR